MPLFTRALEIAPPKIATVSSSSSIHAFYDCTIHHLLFHKRRATHVHRPPPTTKLLLRCRWVAVLRHVRGMGGAVYQQSCFVACTRARTLQTHSRTQHCTLLLYCLIRFLYFRHRKSFILAGFFQLRRVLGTARISTLPNDACTCTPIMRR